MFLIRFDLKCKSDEDFKVGRDFKILEVNGAGAQPTNTYDPKYTFWQVQAILLKHWTKVFSISKASILEGNKPMILAEYKAWRKEVRNYRNKISV